MSDTAADPIPLLDVRDLTVEFETRRGTVQAVQQVNISVRKGETVGIVGESGSGKSVTSYAVMRILDRAGRIATGSITFGGMDLRTVGRQIEDVLIEHVQAGAGDAKKKAIAILEQVRIARPEERYHAYPFELSGG